MKKYSIAIVGATGIVGETLLEILAEREFPVGELYLLASERSAGETLMFNNKSYLVGDIAEFSFENVDFAFFSAGGDVSLQYVPKAAEAGCMVIDNTSAFRYDEKVPLVVPEVNPETLVTFGDAKIIANPNCSTIQLVVALKPIFDMYGIQHLDIATYQSVSGAGREGITALAKETADLLNGQTPEDNKAFSKQIAFNVIPHIDQFEENGYTREEMKMVWETRKILGAPNLMINPTAVRVPVFFGHAEAVTVQLEKEAQVNEVVAMLSDVPGITLLSDTQDYPTPVTDAANHDTVFIGRIRKDISRENSLAMWIVADNVRKGAALNAVQIAELLVHKSLYKH